MTHTGNTGRMFVAKDASGRDYTIVECYPYKIDVNPMSGVHTPFETGPRWLQTTDELRVTSLGNGRFQIRAEPPIEVVTVDPLFLSYP